jgi:hypothetical protein
MFISGCASNPGKDVEWIKHYEHAKNGLVKYNDPQVEAAITYCSEKAFGKGIQINGQYIKRGDELKKIRSDHFIALAKKIRNNKKASVDLDKFTKETKEEILSTPEYIRDISRQEPVYENCFEKEKGFSLLTSTIPFHKVTGKRLIYNRNSHSFSEVE